MARRAAAETVLPNTEEVRRLTRDLSQAARTMSRDEARFLVDAYYQMQENRIRSDHQVRALTASGEPHSVLVWLADQSQVLEKQIARALDSYSGSHGLGHWARSIVGIGPVIAAGLLAHIDIEKAETAGDIWSYAGLDPTKSWGKGEKRPWNAQLKTLCWKLGDSFIKNKGNPNDYYGKYYSERKAYEQERNAAGHYAEQAKRKLEKFKIGKDTDAYKHYSEGRLPPDHIHSRARRYAVKLFLAHYHEVGRKLAGLPVPAPYPIAILGHAHKIEPPNVISGSERTITPE